jgi:hypothetical protein
MKSMIAYGPTLVLVRGYNLSDVFLLSCLYDELVEHRLLGMMNDIANNVAILKFPTCAHSRRFMQAVKETL